MKSGGTSQQHGVSWKAARCAAESPTPRCTCRGAAIAWRQPCSRRQHRNPTTGSTYPAGQSQEGQPRPGRAQLASLPCSTSQSAKWGLETLTPQPDHLEPPDEVKHKGEVQTWQKRQVVRVRGRDQEGPSRLHHLHSTLQHKPNCRLIRKGRAFSCSGTAEPRRQQLLEAAGDPVCGLDDPGSTKLGAPPGRI